MFVAIRSTFDIWRLFFVWINDLIELSTGLERLKKIQIKSLKNFVETT